MLGRAIRSWLKFINLFISFLPDKPLPLLHSKNWCYCSSMQTQWFDKIQVMQI